MAYNYKLLSLFFQHFLVIIYQIKANCTWISIIKRMDGLPN